MDTHGKCNGNFDENDVPLYSEEILKNLDFGRSKVKFSPSISIENPGENLKLRPLFTGDYERGFLQLLSQLTKVGDISREKYLERFYSMKACPDSYYVTVIEDTSRGKIIGSATLTVEKKFIRKTALRGRLEDVVVNNEYRGKQLGKLERQKFPYNSQNHATPQVQHSVNNVILEELINCQTDSYGSSIARQKIYRLVETVRQLAEYVGCYKLTLDCKDQMTKYYSEMGFLLEPGNSNVMSIRFHE